MHRRTAISFGVLLIASMVSAVPMGFAAESEEEQTTSSLTVGTVVDITLSNVPIAWGTLSANTENNLAQTDQGNPATVTVESTTNVNVDIYIKGTNWINGEDNIGADDCCTYDDDNILGEGTETGLNEKTLSTEYDAGPNQGYFEDITPGTSKDTYWFIDIPAGQACGDYSNTIYFKAVKDGNTP